MRYRFGLLWSADSALNKIRMARSIDVAGTLDRTNLFPSPLGSTKKAILAFDAPIRFCGPYVFRTRKAPAAMSLDRPSQLLKALARGGVPTDQVPSV